MGNLEIYHIKGKVLEENCIYERNLYIKIYEEENIIKLTLLIKNNQLNGTVGICGTVELSEN